MKKIVVCFFLISCFGCQLNSSNTENIIRQFSNSKDVQKIHIGSVGMFFIKMFVPDSEFHSATKNVTSLEVLTLKEDCPKEKKDSYRNKLKTLKDSQNYTTLLAVKDGDDNVRIMIKKEKDMIRELIIITCDSEDVVVVKLMGKIKESDLETAIAQYSKKR